MASFLVGMGADVNIPCTIKNSVSIRDCGLFKEAATQAFCDAILLPAICGPLELRIIGNTVFKDKSQSEKRKVCEAEYKLVQLLLKRGARLEPASFVSSIQSHTAGANSPLTISRPSRRKIRLAGPVPNDPVLLAAMLHRMGPLQAMIEYNVGSASWGSSATQNRPPFQQYLCHAKDGDPDGSCFVTGIGRIMRHGTFESACLMTAHRRRVPKSTGICSHAVELVECLQRTGYWTRIWTDIQLYGRYVDQDYWGTAAKYAHDFKMQEVCAALDSLHV